MNLRVERLAQERVSVIAVHGEVDFDTAPALRTALMDAIDEHPEWDLVVDLEGVDFIDSAGLGVLTGGLERARAGGGDLALVATGQNVIRILEITGLNRLFAIHSSRPG